MKKIAFMFVAAALFAACGEKKAAPQEAEVAEVEEAVEVVATAEDSAAAQALVEAIEDQAVKDSCFQVALDSIVAAKAAAPAEEEAAPAEEEAAPAE
ncbi:MAG: hypothetical protein IJ841_00645 [Prevotella sp.]|nr:hypothetical protein [Prevotella sp.]